jgi:hypothetical protein
MPEDASGAAGVLVRVERRQPGVEVGDATPHDNCSGRK